MFDRIAIKEAGKAHYKLHTPDCVIAATLMLFLSGKLGSGASINTGSANIEWRESAKSISSAYLGIILGFIFLAILVAILIAVFVSNVISISGNGWFLRSVRGSTGRTSELFWGFRNGNYMNMVALGALRMLRVFLWGLLLIVPGYIAAYSYYAADYIKAENPSMPAADCLELSKRMMDGHKMEMFVFDMSFLGWFILSSLTCDILGVVFVYPYYYSSRAFAYEHIRAEAVASGRVVEQELGNYV